MLRPGGTWIAAAAVVVALAACTTEPSAEPTASVSGSTASGSTASASAASSAASPTAEPVDLAAYLAQEVQWGDCADDLFLDKDYLDKGFDPDDVQCAKVRVPPVYRGDSGGLDDLEIQLMKDPATDTADRIGALFINPGGPGGSGVGMVQSLELPGSVRARYDVIGFDPRGVSASSPVTCDEKVFYDSLYVWEGSPQNDAEGKARDQAQNNYIRACAKSNPHWWTVNTDNTVKDIDILRTVVGGPESKLNFIGMSYGTTLAAEYIRQFPEHAGRLLIDSPVGRKPPEESLYEQMMSVGKSMNRLFDKCAADSKCPGETREEVQRLVLNMRDDVDAGRLYAAKGPQAAPGQPADFKIASEQTVTQGLVWLTYLPLDSSYPLFRQGLQEVEDYKWAGVFEWAGLNYYSYDYETMKREDNSADAFDVVRCADIDDPTDPQDQVALAERIKKGNEFLYDLYYPGGYVFTAPEHPRCEWTQLAIDDPLIPDPPTEPIPVSNPSNNKYLVVGTTGDNATPYEDATAMAKGLDSPLLTWDSSGHAQSLVDNACMRGVVLPYLLEGKLPSGDVTCKP